MYIALILSINIRFASLVLFHEEFVGCLFIQISINNKIYILKRIYYFFLFCYHVRKRLKWFKFNFYANLINTLKNKRHHYSFYSFYYSLYNLKNCSARFYQLLTFKIMKIMTWHELFIFIIDYVSFNIQNTKIYFSVVFPNPSESSVPATKYFLPFIIFIKDLMLDIFHDCF